MFSLFFPRQKALCWRNAIALLAIFGLNACDDDDAPQGSRFETDAMIARVDANVPETQVDAALIDSSVEFPDSAVIFDATVDAEGIEYPLAPVAIETELGLPSAPAGFANRITCLLLDEEGSALDGHMTKIEVRPSTGWSMETIDGVTEITGHTAGTYYITCVAPKDGLRDTSPARFDVEPSSIEVTYAEVEPTVMVAGNEALVTCIGTDLSGNELNIENAEIIVTPEVSGTTITPDHRVTIRTAGTYEIFCSVDGARLQHPATIDVTPALPAKMVAAISPEKPYYRVGEVFSYEAQVTDAFGNLVPQAHLVWNSEPTLRTFGEGRFWPESEGVYTLYVAVDGNTFNNANLSASTRIQVDAGGPTIACTSPIGMISMGQTTLEGEVNDISDLSRFVIDNHNANIDNSGHFSVAINPKWGLNVHEVRATDAAGNENSIFCPYFASDKYHGENSYFSNAINLHLKQAAIDDGAPSTPIKSLADLLRTIVNSQGLVNTIHQSMLASNPLVPETCKQRVLGVCILKVGVTYKDLALRGPNSFSLSLENGGLRVQAQLKELMFSAKVTGTITKAGEIYVRTADADMSFNVTLSGGKPRVSLKNINQLKLGDLDSNFQGWFTGTILDWLFEIFEGLIRRKVTEALRDFLEDNIDSLLADVLNGVDLANISQSFTVPALAGNEPTTLSLNVGFNELSLTPSRMRMGIKSNVAIQSGHRIANSSLGIPVPPGTNASAELTPRGTMGGSVSLIVVNQLLHSLWRAGMFQMDNIGAALGGLPSDAAISFSLTVPPAVRGAPELGSDAAVEIHFGPAYGSFSYPGLFEEPLGLNLAAKATAAINLSGSEISFNDIELSELYVYLDGLEMSAAQRTTVENTLRSIVQAILDHYLNEILPTFPIPDFAVPQSLQPFGFTPGTRIGLRNPSLKATESQFIVDGTFQQ